jgi:diaminopimelate decarboxylase
VTSPRPLDHAECSRIEARHGSPFYVLHRERFAENMRLFAAAFRSCWERVLVGYSYKTNYLPEFCRLARELGAYAEVVSRLEYDLALRLGQPSGEIIFNGPIKSREDIHAALGAGSTVNLDSWHEVESVAELAARGPFPGRVGLRVNMDLSDAGGASHIQEGLHVSRFGFPPQELRRAWPARACRCAPCTATPPAAAGRRGSTSASPPSSAAWRKSSRLRPSRI